MNKHKIPASITLSQGIIESAAGTSELAVYANNHFGIKCGSGWQGETYYKDDDQLKECFRKYKSVEDSFEDHTVFLKNNRRYENLFSYPIDDYISWAKGLQDAGYATNPEYARILVRVIEEYELYNYDKSYSGHDQTAPIQQHVQTQNELGDDAVIIMGITYRPTANIGHRKVYINNHTRFVVAKKNDTFNKIALDIFSDERFLRKYNDLQKNAQVNEGDIVYIESKRKRGDRDFHVVTSGETIHLISQLYAIRLKSLMSLNGLNERDSIIVGENLWLKRKRPDSSKPSYN